MKDKKNVLCKVHGIRRGVCVETERGEKRYVMKKREREIEIDERADRL